MDIEQQSTQSGQLGKETNVVLIMELTKGLQSKRLGEQCEAIAQFSNVVEKYPFPVVINSLFIKLTDVFIEGSNYLRLSILKTCSECETHLQKMTCLEDVIPKIMNVMHSNDPVARALTLRLFGILCSIMRENKSVHYLVLMQLDSHYTVELDAALWASHKFAASSKSFAASLCPKVKSMLESLSIDTEWKLKLIPLCKHLHHESSTLEEIRACLVNLLTAYQSIDFVITVLRTLTVLAARSPIHAAQQLRLLVERLKIEKRPQAQISILNDFNILAKLVPHIWTVEHIQAFCEFFGESLERTNCQEATLEVFCLMADSVAISIMTPTTTSGEATPYSCAQEAILSQDPGVTSRGVHLLTSLARQGTRQQAEEAASMIVALFSTGWHMHDIPAKDLKIVYQRIASLIIAFPELAKIIDDMNLFESLHKGPLANVRYLCDFLSSVCARVDITTVCPVSPSLLLSKLLTKSDAEQRDLGPQVCALVFQLSTGRPLSPEDQGRVSAYLEQGESAWTAYKVARLASRYGQHKMAALIYTKLVTMAVSEKFVFWLKGLVAVSEAEDLLSSRDEHSFTKLIDVLRAAVDKLYRAKSAFACVSSRELWFHGEYIRVRCKLLNAMYDLAVLASHNYKSDASSSNVKVLTHTLRSFEEAIGDLKQLTERSIDADDATLTHLNLLRCIIQLFTRSIYSIINNQMIEMPTVADLSQDRTHMSKCALELRKYVLEKLTEIAKPGGSNQTPSSRTQQAMEILITLVDNASRVTLCVPRFFFQRLQYTDIRIVLLPKSSVAHEPFSVNLAVGHMLQVMGVVQQKSSLPKLPRKVNKVFIQVFLEPVTTNTSQQQDPAASVSSDPAQFNRVVSVKGDYFTSQFLVCPPATGLFRLRVAVEPRDYTGVGWTTGHSEQMTLRVERVGGGPAVASSSGVTSSSGATSVASGGGQMMAGGYHHRR